MAIVITGGMRILGPRRLLKVSVAMMSAKKIMMGVVMTMMKNETKSDETGRDDNSCLAGKDCW